jgi:hypothetical protein
MDPTVVLPDGMTGIIIDYFPGDDVAVVQRDDGGQEAIKMQRLGHNDDSTGARPADVEEAGPPCRAATYDGFSTCETC